MAIISGGGRTPEEEAAYKAEQAARFEAANPGETFDPTKSVSANNLRVHGNTYAGPFPASNPWYGDNGVLTVDADGNRGTKNTIYDTDLYPDGFNPYGPDNPAPDVGPREVYTPPELETRDPSDPIDMPDFFKRSPENPEWTGAYIPGVPGNPIPGPKGDDFSPFGESIGKLSDSKVFGGLPRSTGPFGISGGYYGGNPYTGQENPLMAAQAAALRGG